MGKGNETVGMRLSPAVVEKLDAYRKVLLWTPGQVLSALLESEERMGQALSTFEAVKLDDGSDGVIVRDDTGEWELCDGPDAERALYWLLEELKKPLSVRFTETFQGWEIKS